MASLAAPNNEPRNSSVVALSLEFGVSSRVAATICCRVAMCMTLRCHSCLTQRRGLARSTVTSGIFFMFFFPHRSLVLADAVLWPPNLLVVRLGVDDGLQVAKEVDENLLWRNQKLLSHKDKGGIIDESEVNPTTAAKCGVREVSVYSE